MADVLLTLVGVWFLAVITPGPDFVVIVRYATAESRWHGVLTAVGSNCSIFLWAAGSMLGLSVVLSRMSWLYESIRLAGAAYLIYLGVRTLWTARKSSTAAEDDPATSLTGRRTGSSTVSLLRAWRAGFLTNAANPKAVVFFGSLLGALLPPQPSASLQVAALVGIVGTSLFWYVLVATLFGSGPVVRVYRLIRLWVDRVTATILIGLGVRLAGDR